MGFASKLVEPAKRFFSERSQLKSPARPAIPDSQFVRRADSVSQRNRLDLISRIARFALVSAGRLLWAA